MTASTPERAPVSRLALAAGATVSRVHRRAGGRAADGRSLARAVSRLWQANEAGDLCIPVSEMFDVSGDDSGGETAKPGDSTALNELLADSPVVALPSDNSTLANDLVLPLVLESGRLYRYAHWQAEQTIAAKMLRLSQRIPAWQADASTQPDGLSAEQPQAWQVISQRDLLLLSGGPGTGKTHTLGATINALRRQRPDLRIALTAPTGKAAARLNQALLGAGSTDPKAVRPVASTLHRLLGMTGNGGYEYGDNNPLPFDLIVVDECSMVDAMLSAQLLSAIGPNTRLVLAGDKDQLASVQAGAFFGDCMAGHDWLAACTVVLNQNFRQADAPSITAWANAVRAGQTELPAPDTQVVLTETEGAQAFAQVVEQACDVYRPLIEAAANAPDAAGTVKLMAQFEKIRVLSALRAGPYGVNSLNAAIVSRLRGPQADGDWFAGRLIIVTSNLPSLSLFNGDIGLTIADGAGGLVVVFESPESADGLRRLMPLELPRSDNAFALTVHQSQGSDFEQVLLLPAPAGHALATRAGLYTAMTRARKLLGLFARKEDLRWAVSHTEQRAGGLVDRLARQQISGQSDNNPPR